MWLRLSDALKILEALTENVDGLPEREQLPLSNGFSDHSIHPSSDEKPHIHIKKLRER
jgi:hypothetical protein